jgi:amino acid transporter
MIGGPAPVLKPTLGLLDATAIGVGAIIGAGIFVVTGIAAARAGSAVVVSMLIAAAISLLTALSFAELTAWLPKEGSVYELARRLLSPFAGFVTGWMWIVSNTFAGAAVSLGFAYYVAALAPEVPARWLAAGVCLAFTALNHFGVRASAVLNNALVPAKLLVLVLFCLLGALSVRRANFTPFDPASLGAGCWRRPACCSPRCWASRASRTRWRGAATSPGSSPASTRGTTRRPVRCGSPAR